LVNSRIDIISDDLDPAIAVQHVAATDVGTADARPVLIAALVLERWEQRQAADVVIGTGVHRLIISRIIPR
jgi:hypothetical protein